MEQLYCVKKQIGDRIWTLREDNEWTSARHFRPWLGDKNEAHTKARLHENLESGDRRKARYYIEPTEWESLHI